MNDRTPGRFRPPLTPDDLDDRPTRATGEAAGNGRDNGRPTVGGVQAPGARGRRGGATAAADPSTAAGGAPPTSGAPPTTSPPPTTSAPLTSGAPLTSSSRPTAPLGPGPVGGRTPPRTLPSGSGPTSGPAPRVPSNAGGGAPPMAGGTGGRPPVAVPPRLAPDDVRALPAMAPVARPSSDGYIPPALTAVTPVTSLASRRILRRVNLWSVLKISMILYLALFLVGAVASLVVWKAADSAGLIGKVENLMQELGFKNFEFVGEKLFFDYVLFSLLLAGLAIVGTLVAAMLYNLIAEIVGGVEVTVVEQVAFLEEVEVEEFVYDDPDFVDDPDDPLERRRFF